MMKINGEIDAAKMKATGPPCSRSHQLSSFSPRIALIDVKLASAPLAPTHYLTKRQQKKREIRWDDSTAQKCLEGRWNEFFC